MVSSRFLCSKPSPWGVYRLPTQSKSQSPGNGPTVPPDLHSLSSDAGLLADSPAHRHISISGPLPLLSFPLPGALPPQCSLPVGAPSQLVLPPSWCSLPVILRALPTAAFLVGLSSPLLLHHTLSLAPPTVSFPFHHFTFLQNTLYLLRGYVLYLLIFFFIYHQHPKVSFSRTGVFICFVICSIFST